MTAVQTALTLRAGAVQTDGLLRVTLRLTMKQPEHADTNATAVIFGITLNAPIRVISNHVRKLPIQRTNAPLLRGRIIPVNATADTSGTAQSANLLFLSATSALIRQAATTLHRQ